MAKKKKKGKAANNKRDARGYGQATPSPTAPAVMQPSSASQEQQEQAKMTVDAPAKQQQQQQQQSQQPNDGVDIIAAIPSAVDDADALFSDTTTPSVPAAPSAGVTNSTSSSSSSIEQQQPSSPSSQEQQIHLSKQQSASVSARRTIRIVPPPTVIAPTPTASSSNNNTTTTIMTAALQDRLEALLEDLQQYHQLLQEQEPGQTSTATTTRGTAKATSTGPSDRFEKRLAGVYDYLIHYGFILQQIEQVVVALGHDITLPLALDWLCLHDLDNSSTELPALFTEGQVREAASQRRQQQQQQQQSNNGTSSTTTSLIEPTVLIIAPANNLPPSSQEEEEEQQQQSTVCTTDQARPTTHDESTLLDVDDAKEMCNEKNHHDDNDDDDDSNNDDDDDDDVMHKAAEKERLMQMYQYEEEEADAVDTTTDAAAAASVPTTTTTTTTTPNDEAPRQAEKVILLPEEERFMAAQEELEAMQADLKDEAANYMRSKYEIKVLQKRAQQMKKQVAGLQRKATQARAAAAAVLVAEQEQQPEKEEQNGNSESSLGNACDGDDEDEGGGMFDIFNMNGTAAAETTSSNEKSTNDAAVQDPSPNHNGIENNTDVVPEDAIPKSWTGKTPKAVLEDWCRKQKLPRPTFTKLPQNGCIVRVKLNNNSNSKSNNDDNDNIIEVQQDGPIRKFIDSQHYTSTKILYQINPDLPLYRLFPPAYRDLWNSWALDVQTEKNQAMAAEDEARRAILDHLLQLIPTKSPLPRPTNATKPNSSTPKHDQGGDMIKNDNDGDAFGDVVTEDWEDLDRLDEKVTLSKVPIASSGNSTMKTKKTKLNAGFQRLQKAFRDRQTTPKYKAMYQQRCTLPIHSYRDEILESIDKNPVTVLCAETGAGKTTQCPQYLLEHALQGDMGREGSASTCILVSQPRRIAATSVAERVAEEMCERSVGNLVGYQIRLEAKRTAQTRLLFCTTGVVLRRLIDDPCLSGVTHVVVDEVHERQWQIDVLLVSLRRLIDGPRPDLKVLLMSATLDTRLFCSFFHGAPVLNIPGRTFPVANYYLEDLMEATDHVIEDWSQLARRDYKQKETTRMWITQRGGDKRQETVMTENELDEVSDDYAGYKMSTRRSMDRVDETKINYDLIEDVLLKLLVDKVLDDGIVPPENAHLQSGAVLIFLPGIGEIRTLSERLQSSRIFGNKKRFEVIPMHSALSSADQRKAFQVPRKVEWAIIVSTNIAETSVTIPDAVCVIDSGRVREVRHDKRTLTRKLVTDWCSRASTKQRGGRAGRVQPGICLKLFSSMTERSMNAATEPEIKRLPLEEVCLTILAGGFARNCVEFLGQTPQPPGDDAVRLALGVLAEIGAVAFGPDSTELLTPLGRHLAKLPVDCRLGKMLIFGVVLKCIDTIATIVAGLSASQSLFVTSLNDGQLAKAKKAAFAYPDSDFLTLVNVYEAYMAADKIGRGRQFCRENYVSFSALREIKDGRKHYLELLKGIGFSVQSSPISRTINGSRKDEGVIHSVICAGLYPNVARIDRSPSGADSVCHKKERLFIHSSSVNVKLPRYLPSSWLAFHEKFGTSQRVSISTCCFVHPFALLLFGGTLDVRHAERRVILDDWIEIPLAAKTGVIFVQLRQHIDAMLEAAVQSTDGSFLDQQEVSRMVQGIVGLLS